MKETLRIFAELNKVKITAAVSFTTMAGFVLMKQRIDTDLILPVIGIFILACGSSIINHYQERESDAKMERTKNRPIPSGKITAINALIMAIIEIIIGSVILFVGTGLTGLILGLIALIWYNGIYTNLKKITAHAVIPGALIGSIPPLVGWVAAGGSLMDPKAWVIAIFFFIWQVPHFMLLALKFSKDYQEAKFPNIAQTMTQEQIKRSIFIWILATALISILFPLSKIITSSIAIFAISAVSLLIVLVFLQLLWNKEKKFNPRKYFKYINYYVLMVLIIICMDQFI